MSASGRKQRAARSGNASPPEPAAPPKDPGSLHSVLFRHSPMPMLVVDTAGRVEDANAGACALFGYPRDEMMGLSGFDLLGPEEPTGPPDGIERPKPSSLQRERRQLRRRNGEVFTADVTVAALADGCHVVNIRALSGDLPTEEALRQSEARYAAVVEHATVGITLTDGQWHFVDVNPRACEIFGYPREQLLRMTVQDMAAVGELERVPLREPELGAGLDTFATRRIRRADGAERVVEIRARDLGGGEIVSVVTDVTERADAERRLARAERSLAKAQELAHFGTWEVDLGTFRARWSPEMYRMYGLAPDNVAVTYEMFASRLHPEDRPRIEQLIREVMEGEEVPRTYEHRILRDDGSVRVAHATIDFQRDAAGRVVRLVGSSEDITERRLLEVQLREAQKLEAIGRLAGGVAHDFNNLLTVILGFTESMLDDMPVDDCHRSNAEQVRQAARRAAGLTQQLLAFGRRQVFRLEVFDLNQVLGEMRDILRRLIGEQIEITISPGARRASIRADRGQMEQVIFNLALNARDAMSSGGRLRIATRNVEVAPRAPSASSATGLLLTVSDTGMGMSPEVMAHIFEPFYTTKDVGQGTGLGLATVYGIVTQTGGTVEVSSDPGQGTVFRIQLPCAGDEPAPAAAESAAPEVGGEETVLLAEDDPGVRGLVAEVLRRRGYCVLEAPDGDEAMALSARHAGLVHLLIADVVMPGTNGRDLARRLLRDRPGLRVLFISGYSDERVELDGLEVGTVGFLQKPFPPAVLAARVRELLDAPEGGSGRP